MDEKNPESPTTEASLPAEVAVVPAAGVRSSFNPRHGRREQAHAPETLLTVLHDESLSFSMNGLIELNFPRIVDPAVSAGEATPEQVQSR